MQEHRFKIVWYCLLSKLTMFIWVLMHNLIWREYQTTLCKYESNTKWLPCNFPQPSPSLLIGPETDEHTLLPNLKSILLSANTDPLNLNYVPFHLKVNKAQSFSTTSAPLWLVQGSFASSSLVSSSQIVSYRTTNCLLFWKQQQQKTQCFFLLLCYCSWWYLWSTISTSDL